MTTAAVTSAPLSVAVLGLGEAGSAIAADLVRAGAHVRAYDPAGHAVDGATRAANEADAARGAEVVVSLNSAAVAVEVAQAAALAPGQLYADANTAAPALKRELATALEPTGAAFADVALLGPVPGHGLKTAALVAGAGAERFAAALSPLGMPITVVGPEPGDAAARKLARSVFMKGLAAAVAEALAAADAIGCADWLREDLETTLARADAGLVGRLMEGSHRHAVRRTEEMAAAAAMLEELGVEPRVASAAESWLRALSGVRR
jgi:3-hydroxyisobutyrate dehydrogenase-like beta-hydroxyacid dehydrogenase